jgi:xanthine dehydrogenase FAD-binding subunit
MYDISSLFEAGSVAEAVALLEEHPAAKIIAGGSDVLIQIREGRLAGTVLVSIQGLDELRGVSLESVGEFGAALRIGSLSSFSHITRDPLIQKYIPVLGEAVDLVGGPQIRNIGTIGGNVSNGVSSADSASTLTAYDAVMEYTGSAGIRHVPIRQHYISAGKVALRHDEILTAILIPSDSYAGCFGYYIKYSMRNAMDIATLGCSVNVVLSDDKKTITRCRVAFGVAGPVPVRSPTAEQRACGSAVTPQTLDEIAAAVLADVRPRDSWRASAELRLHLAQELTRRALAESIRRAGGAV